MTESQEQKEIIAWFRSTWPQYAHCLRVSQSGAFRGAGRKGAIRTAQVTAMGGITGESDIAILCPRNDYGCLLIEHKADTATVGATKAQLEYIRQHNRTGNYALVTKGVDMAKQTITQYMAGEINR